MTLANGVTRDFRARVGALDGRATEDLDKREGKIRSEGNKGGDAQRVGEAAAGGSQRGCNRGQRGRTRRMGVGIGAGAGAAAALVGVLLSRGPDAVLAKGTTLEMVVDRDLIYDESEVEPVAEGATLGEGSRTAAEPQATDRADAGTSAFRLLA